MTGAETQGGAGLPIVVRPAASGDAGFILSSWLRSYRESPEAKSMLRPVYEREHATLIRRLLSRCGARVVTLASDESRIIAWACDEERAGSHVVHYVYTKRLFRQFGLASRLLGAPEPEAIVWHTHRTRAGEGLAKRLTSVFNPYLR